MTINELVCLVGLDTSKRYFKEQVWKPGFSRLYILSLTHTHTQMLHTRLVALWRHLCGCASSGRLLLCTPSQNTHALESGSTQTGWPGRDGVTCSQSRRCASRTSDCRRKEKKRVNRNMRRRRNGECRGVKEEVKMGGCGREEINEGLSGGEGKPETFTHN